MSDKDQKRISKLMSLVLRHQPSAIGLTLDEGGWALVDELLACMAKRKGLHVSRALLKEVVADNDKQRFRFSDDGERIRASQGHSLNVALGLPPAMPPKRLYHGTATRFYESIMDQGLISGSRQHVHLSAEIETAIKVGSRHGKPLVLLVDSEAMAALGILFYCSDNGVWLTDNVATRFLSLEG